MTATDAELIEASLRVPEKFALLFDRHAPHIQRYLARRLGQQIADDLLAETFLAAFTKRERYDSSRPDARPWLYGIATNLLRRHRRDEERALRALARTGTDPLARGDGVEESWDRVTDRIDAAAASQPLAKALAAMPGRHRDALLLYAWGQLSYSEIAVALNISVGTVRSRLSRAKARLRTELAPANPNDSYALDLGESL